LALWGDHATGRMKRTVLEREPITTKSTKEQTAQEEDCRGKSGKLSTRTVQEEKIKNRGFGEREMSRESN